MTVTVLDLLPRELLRRLAQYRAAACSGEVTLFFKDGHVNAYRVTEHHKVTAASAGLAEKEKPEPVLAR